MFVQLAVLLMETASTAKEPTLPPTIQPMELRHIEGHDNLIRSESSPAIGLSQIALCSVCMCMHTQYRSGSVHLVMASLLSRTACLGIDGR